MQINELAASVRRTMALIWLVVIVVAVVGYLLWQR